MPENPTIVLATRNSGKVRELASPLAAFGLKVVGLNAFAGLPEVEETGATFAANALFKAVSVARATGCVAVADDSGLEVDALGGAPGVLSARYWQPGDALPGMSGADADTLSLLSQDERNIRKLLAALAAVPEARRTARFRCAMCAARPGDAAACPETDALTAHGLWEGSILREPRGTGGFGYDPVFLDPEAGLSAASMPADMKMRRSHRGMALAELLRLWPAWWNRE